MRVLATRLRELGRVEGALPRSMKCQNDLLGRCRRGRGLQAGVPEPRALLGALPGAAHWGLFALGGHDEDARPLSGVAVAGFRGCRPPGGGRKFLISHFLAESLSVPRGSRIAHPTCEADSFWRQEIRKEDRFRSNFSFFLFLLWLLSRA